MKWRLSRFVRLSLALVWVSLGLNSGIRAELVEPPAEAPPEAAGHLVLDRKTRRLELRDASGKILTEIVPGTIDRRVQEGRQVFRVSFGRDTADRFTAVIRPLAGQAWLRLGVAGREFILSPGASLLATWGPEKDFCRYDGSISGKVWMWQSGLGQNWVLMIPKDP